MEKLTHSLLNDWQISEKWETLEGLRKQVQEDKKAMDYYNKLKDINRNDVLYGWMFSGDAILTDTLDDLSLYQNAYVRDILTVYNNELENILIKINL